MLDNHLKTECPVRIGEKTKFSNDKLRKNLIEKRESD